MYMYNIGSVYNNIISKLTIYGYIQNNMVKTMINADIPFLRTSKCNMNSGWTTFLLTSLM